MTSYLVKQTSKCGVLIFPRRMQRFISNNHPVHRQKSMESDFPETVRHVLVPHPAMTVRVGSIQGPLELNLQGLKIKLKPEEDFTLAEEELTET